MNDRKLRILVAATIYAGAKFGDGTSPEQDRAWALDEADELINLDNIRQRNAARIVNARRCEHGFVPEACFHVECHP